MARNGLKELLKRNRLSNFFPFGNIPDCHEKLLLNEEDNILPYLLLPLAGPEEFTADENDELPLDLQYLPPDKEREKGKEVCKLLMESLLHVSYAFHLWQSCAIAIKTKRRSSKLVITENKTRQILQNTNIFLRPDTHRLTSIPLKIIRKPLVF